MMSAAEFYHEVYRPRALEAGQIPISENHFLSLRASQQKHYSKSKHVKAGAFLSVFIVQ